MPGLLAGTSPEKQNGRMMLRPTKSEWQKGSNRSRAIQKLIKGRRLHDESPPQSHKGKPKIEIDRNSQMTPCYGPGRPDWQGILKIQGLGNRYGIKNRKGNTSIVDGYLETTVTGQAINQQKIKREGYWSTSNQ